MKKLVVLGGGDLTFLVLDIFFHPHHEHNFLLRHNIDLLEYIPKVKIDYFHEYIEIDLLLCKYRGNFFHLNHLDNH